MEKRNSPSVGDGAIRGLGVFPQEDTSSVEAGNCAGLSKENQPLTSTKAGSLVMQPMAIPQSVDVQQYNISPSKSGALGAVL